MGNEAMVQKTWELKSSGMRITNEGFLAADYADYADYDLGRVSMDQRTYRIIGAAMEVHNQLGSGFLEVVYQEALAFEFRQRGIPFEREVELPILYKGVKLTAPYFADFVAYGTVIVELKSVSGLAPAHEAQVIHYLRASGLSVGLLFNFGSASLQQKRLVLTPNLNLRNLRNLRPESRPAVPTSHSSCQKENPPPGEG